MIIDIGELEFDLVRLEYHPQQSGSIIKAVIACDGADDPQPGELARLRAEVERLREALDIARTFVAEAQHHDRRWHREVAARLLEEVTP